MHPSDTVEENQWEQELEACRNSVERWCYRFLKNAQEAEDAAQQTLIKAWQQRHSFRGDASLTTWLYRIASNHCLNTLRRKPMQSLDAERNTPTVKATDGASDPIEKVERRIFIAQALDRIHELARTRKPPWDTMDWLIFEAYFQAEEQTWPQVAAVLGKPVDTVKYRFYQRILPTLEEVNQQGSKR